MGTLGLQLGPNGLCGTATLITGTVVFNLSRPWNDGAVFLATRRTAGTGVQGILRIAPTSPGTRTSLTITSTEATDDGEVNWAVIEPR